MLKTMTAIAAMTMPSLPVQEAQLETAIQGVATFADAGEFEALERLFADEVDVDYSSLSGQPMETKAASQLMSEWGALLPGFDATRHELTNITVSIDGDSATGGADVTATHWLGADQWQVVGNYEYRFTRTENGWAINAMTFNLQEQSGNAAIIQQALDIASKRN